MPIKRGEIYHAILDGTLGSEQSGKRYVLIIQNNQANLHSPVVIVAPLTSAANKARLLPTHVLLSRTIENGLRYPSIVLLEQIRTVTKDRLDDYIGNISFAESEEVNYRLKISLAIDEVQPDASRRNPYYSYGGVH